MGVMLSAGGSLQWWRNQMAEKERAEAKRQGRDPYELLCEEAAKVGPGSEGLIFLPYLTGERTPHADPFARGGWVGLTARHTRAHLIRALLEGITYGMRDSLEIIRGMGVPIEEIRVSGGGARSAFWRQMQADIYGQPVHTINATEGPAYGAALLAAVGTGVYKDIAEACDAAIRTVSRTEVDRVAAQVYERYYPVFRRLYPALKSEMRNLAELASS
jgi:xylulokinase